MLSAANGGVRRISMVLTDQPQITLSNIKQMVSRELPEDRKLVEPYFSSANSVGEVLKRVQNATSCSEIFDAIGTPQPENALDILC
jgi:hypothetical protein